MSDIIFIKNEEDYLNYKKLRPVKFYSRQKVKFKCKSCGKECIKAFYYLDLNFLCGNCKNKQTCLNKYGVENPSQVNQFKEKAKQTCLTKYGVSNYSKTKEFNKKRTQTCLEKYGVENPFQVSEYIEKANQTRLEKYGSYSFPKTKEFDKKRTQTCLEKYGVENPFQDINHIEKSKYTCIKKYGVDNYRKTDEYHQKNLNKLNLKLINYNLTAIKNNNNHITLKCNNCNNLFNFSIGYFYSLLNNYNENFCPHCTRIIEHGKSLKEKELLEYIKTIYNKQIDINVRNIISPKEIDIYLSDLKIGFEFDGTYFHADSRFYTSTDYIKKCEKYAKEIWEKDKEKDLICESLGIKLIRIKEYDWDNFKTDIKEKIKKLIIGE